MYLVSFPSLFHFTDSFQDKHTFVIHVGGGPWDTFGQSQRAATKAANGKQATVPRWYMASSVNNTGRALTSHKFCGKVCPCGGLLNWLIFKNGIVWPSARSVSVLLGHHGVPVMARQPDQLRSVSGKRRRWRRVFNRDLPGPVLSHPAELRQHPARATAVAGGRQLRRVFRPARRPQEAGAPSGGQRWHKHRAIPVGADSAVRQRVQSVFGKPADCCAQRIRGGQRCSVKPPRGLLWQAGYSYYQHHDQTQR